MLPRQGVVYAFVIEDGAHNITDMISFYSLSSTILGNDKHRTLRAAYCYYYFNTRTKLNDLMTDALILARHVT